LSMAASNILFLFVWKGGLELLFVVCAINGAPLGAKFLADAILADIIDYDEFLTGMRSEATYFMFKSFLPKIVQIPATAVPIALLGVFSYKAPIGGKPQDQPESVANYIRGVVGLGFLCSLCAYFLKTRYPMREEGVPRLAKALKEHKEGRWARDPVSGRPYKPMTIDHEDEQEVFWLFNHFDGGNLQYAFSQRPSELGVPEDDLRQRFDLGSDYLVWSTTTQLNAAVCFLVFAVLGTACSMVLLDNPKWQFVPTLFVVCIGFGISSTAFSYLRSKAAKAMVQMAADGEHNLDNLQRKVQRLLTHQAELAQLGLLAQNAKEGLDALADADVCLKCGNTGWQGLDSNGCLCSCQHGSTMQQVNSCSSAAPLPANLRNSSIKEAPAPSQYDSREPSLEARPSEPLQGSAPPYPSLLPGQLAQPVEGKDGVLTTPAFPPPILVEAIPTPVAYERQYMTSAENVEFSEEESI
jgi:hypothetical protein